MKTNGLLALAAALMLSFGLYGQSTISITGKVFTEEQQPIPKAKVSIETKTGKKFKYTDSKGFYRFNVRKNQKYLITARLFGYQTDTSSLNPNQDAQVNFVLKEKYTTTEEVLIATVRPPEDAPVSMTTADKADIEKRYQGQDGAFLIEELSPSVVTYSESGTNLSNYAGLRLRGIDQTRVNMTLNGVPLNDMIDQGVFFSNFTDFGNSIESVQIQRGVGTSSNGTSSYAGSINFESINLENTEAQSSLMFTTGSFGTLRGGAEVSTGLLENNTSFYLRYTETHADGYRYNTGTNARSFFFSGGYFGNKHSLKLTAFNGRSKNGLGYGPVAISDIENDPRTNYVSENDVDDFGQFMTQLQHIYAIDTRKKLISTVYYSGAGGDFPFGYTDANGSFAQINYPLYNDHIGAMSNFDARFFEDALQLNLGVHANRFFRNNLEQIVPNYSDPYYDDNTRKDELAGFLKANYSLRKFDFFGDVQVRGVNLIFFPDHDFLGEITNIPDRNWIFVNSTGGVTYSVNEKLNAYGSFGRTGREPTRFDILGSTQINPFNVGLAQDVNQVVPEYVNDVETGLRWKSEKLAISLNGFYMQFENEIAPIGEFIPQGFVQVYENQAPSERYGVEVDFAYGFLRKFRFSGHATYMRANISSYEDPVMDIVYRDVTPILTPELNAQGTLTYEPIERLAFDLRGRYLSEAYMELTNDPEFVVPASFVMDIRARYKFYKEHTINIQFNNILDAQYYTYGAPTTSLSGNPEPGYYVQPPRHIYVTLQFNF